MQSPPGYAYIDVLILTYNRLSAVIDHTYQFQAEKMPGLTIFSKFCVLNSFLLMTKKITLVTKKSTYSLYFLINQYIQQQLRYLILQNVAIKVSLKIFWPKNLGVLVMMTPNQQLYYPLLTFGRQLRWSKMCGFSCPTMYYLLLQDCWDSV